MQTINIPKKKGFASFFTNQDELAIDFIKSLLVYNPNKRLSVEAALNHAYVAEFHDVAEEIVKESPVLIKFNENKKLQIKDYRDAIYEEIIKKHGPQAI